MKKNKEWLESVIRKELMTNSGNPDMTTYEQGRVSGLKYYLNLINQLDEPDSTDEYRKGYEQGVLNAIQTANESKLVEIPQFVADWIETCKGYKDNLFGVYQFAPEVVSDWIFENESKKERVDLIARVWLDGYIIAQETKMQITIKSYDKTELEIELPESEAKKLIDQLKEVSE